MGDMAEDRVYDDDDGTTEVVIAAGVGIVSVSVSGDHIGRFGVAHRCSPRDVAADDAVLAVATDEDILLREEGEFVPTGFGQAVAVGVHEGTVIGADDDGRIARFGDAWTDVDAVGASVRAIDGPLLATDDGVYRIRDGEGSGTIRSTGLETANDVAARGPFAATDAGLYTLGNGWRAAVDGSVESVAALSQERACAAGEAFYGRDDDGWRTVDLPADDPVSAVAFGDRAYVITENGTLLAGPEWRSRSLGIGDIGGITAIPTE